MTEATQTLLEVKLPVCTECQQVGKQMVKPGGGMRFACVGTRENPHRRAAMTLRTFREVRELPEAA